MDYFKLAEARRGRTYSSASGGLAGLETCHGRGGHEASKGELHQRRNLHDCGICGLVTGSDREELSTKRGGGSSRETERPEGKDVASLYIILVNTIALKQLSLSPNPQRKRAAVEAWSGHSPHQCLLEA